MADPRFFLRHGPFTLSQIAGLCGACVAEGGDGGVVIADVAPLESAGPKSLSFLANVRYLDAFATSKAGACIVSPDHAERAPPGMQLLLSETPYRAYARAASAFYPADRPDGLISADAVISSSARIGEGASVEPGAVIGAAASIGPRSAIGANAVIGPNVEIGEDSSVGALASLSHCIIGKRVSIFPGVRIGQDGFGFDPNPAGFVKVPQLGRVIVHDDVEIGANTAIDRGSGPDTVIGEGCRIDNLVQIGHNVQLGRGCVIVAQVGISGSTKLGDFVFVGGQAAFGGHIRVGQGAQIAAQSGVIRDVAAGGRLGGSPAVPTRQWHRQTVMVARLAKKREAADE